MWTRVATWVLLLIFTSGMSAGFMTCLPVVTGMYSNASNPERHVDLCGLTNIGKDWSWEQLRVSQVD